MVVVRRLQRSIDFERVLKTRSRASSTHFAVHHLASPPAPRGTGGVQMVDRSSLELSTGSAPAAAPPVDDSELRAIASVWLGAVVPKRHARRAVTRSLLKRQIRNVVADGAAALENGLWVVRLRAPFDRAAFPSAASDLLRQQARSELQAVLAAAIERQSRR